MRDLEELKARAKAAQAVGAWTTILSLIEEIERLRGALEGIARRAKSEPWPDHFAAEPPDWAEDEWNGGASSCGYCGAWLTVVRPGKSQCDCCSDGQDLGAIARSALREG